MAGVALSYAEESTWRINFKGVAVRFLVLHQGTEPVELIWVDSLPEVELGYCLSQSVWQVALRGSAIRPLLK